ncbi:MAG: PASTA domain-containing protein [Elusimicrobia bacterium]|nr:PASTA domain-containing protein [Elusimicrobiota bacterium]
MGNRHINTQFIVIGVIILGVCYIIFNLGIAMLIHSRKELVVPDIQGKSVYESLTILSSQGLALRKESEEYNKSLPAGVVLRQNPLSGMRVKEGKTVRVVISQGGEFSFVPSLIGQKSRSAALTIRSYGLVLGEESSSYSVVYDKDYVIAQDPPKGTLMAKDTMVNIVVSLGPPPPNVKLMPKFIGKNINDVSTWADNNNIDVNVTKENVSNSVTGAILEQSPEPDTDVTNIRQINVKIVGVPE